jgi:NADH-quinone oxidoreductase subunit L
MFLATGVGSYPAGMFHLTSHAFMKALLFLGSGSVMHAMADETDMRKMGGLRSKIPWTWLVFLVGVLAMSGIPPLVGFFSKDLILEKVIFSGNTLLWGVGLFTAMLTAFYLLRAYFMTFHGQPRYDEKKIHPHESPPVMLWPLRILALLSIAGGALWVALFGFSFTPLDSFLAPVFKDVVHVNAEQPEPLFSESTLILFSVLVALVGIGIAYLTYVRGFRVAEGVRKVFRPVYLLLSRKYFVDELYDWVIVKPLQLLSRFLASIFDLTILDGLINGIGRLIGWTGGVFRSLQAGYIRSYAAWVLLGTLGILIYLLLR